MVAGRGDGAVTSESTDLIARVSEYVEDASQLERIRSAYDFADRCHDGQMRRSGDQLYRSLPTPQSNNAAKMALESCWSSAGPTWMTRLRRGQQRRRAQPALGGQSTRSDRGTATIESSTWRAQGAPCTPVHARAGHTLVGWLSSLDRLQRGCAPGGG